MAGAKPSVQFVEVTQNNQAQRVDNFLISRLKGVPKSKIYRIIRKGEVRINKKRCKPETKLQIGDIVRIPPVIVSGTENAFHVSESLKNILKNAILYEDDDVMVLNKPAGLAVHGGSGLSFGMIEGLRACEPEARFLELVHRLDRETSGCILVAKNRRTLKQLHEEFRLDRVNKIYHALVFGKWPRHKRRVEAPLKKNTLKSGERVVVVHQDGKQSQTEFRVLQSGTEFSLIEAKPITGRTHQIRVHAAFSGHPIVGDDKYAIQQELKLKESEFFPVKPRLMLHAREIRFSLRGADGGETKEMQFVAEYDDRYRKVLDVVDKNQRVEKSK